MNPDIPQQYWEGLPFLNLGPVNNAYLHFKEEALSLKGQFPELNLGQTEDGIPTFEGKLILSDEKSNPIDSYEIRIVCSVNYPQSFPFVFETKNRIPINIDWHVHTDGHACLCTWPEEVIYCHKGITLESFLSEHVIPYFFNQKYREMHGFFLQERAHGNLGTMDFFKEKFRTSNLKLIINWLEFIKSNPEPSRTNECFCGSGEKFRKCHRDEFREFKKLPVEIIGKFIDLIKRQTHFYESLWK
ncbi:MAG: SEC-C domain-containing protein [Cecembia sp.]